jgi:hypothetical protein
VPLQVARDAHLERPRSLRAREVERGAKLREGLIAIWRQCVRSAS